MRTVAAVLMLLKGDKDVAVFQGIICVKCPSSYSPMPYGNGHPFSWFTMRGRWLYETLPINIGNRFTLRHYCQEHPLGGYESKDVLYLCRASCEVLSYYVPYLTVKGILISQVVKRGCTRFFRALFPRRISHSLRRWASSLILGCIIKSHKNSSPLRALINIIPSFSEVGGAKVVVFICLPKDLVKKCSFLKNLLEAIAYFRIFAADQKFKTIEL